METKMRTSIGAPNPFWTKLSSLQDFQFNINIFRNLYHRNFDLFSTNYLRFRSTLFQNQGNGKKEKSRNAKLKHKLSFKTTRSKKRMSETEKVVFNGFEYLHCPQEKGSDSEKGKERKYLQSLVLCRKITYYSNYTGHSLWVNYKAVRWRDFHKSKSSLPTARVKDGRIVTEESGGSKLRTGNLVQYELSRKK